MNETCTPCRENVDTRPFAVAEPAVDVIRNDGRITLLADMPAERLPTFGA